jgi:rod shape-determining protein MreD
MKYWTVAAILFFNNILQSTLFPFLQIAGIQPDTLIVLITCFGLLGGTGYGVFTGIAGGLLQDILYGGPIGMNALIYMVIGYLTGLLYERIFVDRYIVPTSGLHDAGLPVLFKVALFRGLWIYSGDIAGGLVYRNIYAFYLLLDVPFVPAEIYEKEVAIQEKIALLLFYLSRT